PIPKSKEYLDEIYDSSTDLHKKAVLSLNKYGKERLKHEVKVTFSVIRDILEKQKNFEPLNRIVNPGSANPIKASFYALFMAFHQLVVKEEKSPDQHLKVVDAIKGLQKEMVRSAHYSTTEDRTKNIDKT